MAATKLRNRQIEVTTDFDHGGQKITNLGAPTANSDGATKQYVDNAVMGLRDPKDAVRVATTANHGLSGLSAIDGVTPVAGDRILVKNQTAQADNGIYVAASGAWARSSDADTSAEVTQGMSCYVVEGTLQANRTYALSTADPITLGTTALTFVQIGGSTVNFANRETPSGSINGSNVTFTLANTPTAGSEQIFLNGILQQAGASDDYTISGATITMASAPVTGDRLLANYRY